MGFGLSFVSILLNCALVCIGQVKIENVDLTNRFMKYLWNQLCSQVGGTAYTDNNKLWPKKNKAYPAWVAVQEKWHLETSLICNQ